MSFLFAGKFAFAAIRAEFPHRALGGKKDETD
jgi:hypothetical protein